MDVHFRVLGLPRGANKADLTKAYRQKALTFHPDRNPGGAEEFKRVHTSYQALLAHFAHHGGQDDRSGPTSRVAAHGAGFSFARQQQQQQQQQQQHQHVSGKGAFDSGTPLMTDDELFADVIPGGWLRNGAARGGGGGGLRGPHTRFRQSPASQHPFPKGGAGPAEGRDGGRPAAPSVERRSSVSAGGDAGRADDRNTPAAAPSTSPEATKERIAQELREAWVRSSRRIDAKLDKQRRQRAEAATAPPEEREASSPDGGPDEREAAIRERERREQQRLQQQQEEALARQRRRQAAAAERLREAEQQLAAERAATAAREAQSQTHAERLAQERRALVREAFTHRFAPSPAAVGDMSDTEVFILWELYRDIGRKLETVLQARMSRAPCTRCGEATGNAKDPDSAHRFACKAEVAADRRASPSPSPPPITSAGHVTLCTACMPLVHTCPFCGAGLRATCNSPHAESAAEERGASRGSRSTPVLPPLTASAASPHNPPPSSPVPPPPAKPTS